MKTIFKTSLIVLLSIVLIQCKTQKETTENKTIQVEEHDHSSHSHEEEKKHEHIYMARSTEVDTMNVDGFNVLFYSYFKIREALSMDNNIKTADYSGSMYRAVSKINSDELSENMKSTWLARAELIREGASKIANSADKLEVQRAYVSQLSVNLLDLMKVSNLKKTVYLFHCESSNEDKGGSWLSMENNIETSPYQNKDSEPCGFILETLGN